MDENIIHISIVKGLPWDVFKDIAREYTTDTVFCLHGNASRNFRMKWFCVCPEANLTVWKRNIDNFRDLLHNPYGPAMSFDDGRVEFYLYGARYKEVNDWLAKANIPEKQKAIYKIKYGK